jgi:hypothetical protein
VVRRANEVETSVEGDAVRFTEMFMSPRWERPQVRLSALSLLGADLLASFLANAASNRRAVRATWPATAERHPPELITIARRA